VAHVLPTGFSQSFNMPYDGSPHAHPSAQNYQQHTYSQSFPNGPVSNPGYARSFGEGYASGRNYGAKPQIYTVRYMNTPSAFDCAY
jgi:regulatory protein SWI6